MYILGDREVIVVVASIVFISVAREVAAQLGGNFDHMLVKFY
jgi:hypothetical protein